MLRHNLILIYRNFKRFKSTFLINLLGLSTGLACALLIYLWVDDELHVDKFHEKDNQLFQVMEHQQHSQSIRVTDSTPGLLAEALEEEMPEVEYATVATPFYWFDKFTLSVHERKIEAVGIYAGKNYFNLFSYGLIQGDASRVLADKNSIVISRKIARSLFNTTENLLGRTIDFQHEKQYVISGVFEGTPSNSSTQFDFVLSYDVAKEINPGLLNWGNSGPLTFITLKKGTNVEAFNRKIAGLIKTKTKDKHRTLFSRKYSDAYLFGNYENNGVQSGGRIDYVIQFSIIALFILVIGCINFMNLSTAKASRRIKEIGIKKAVGAGRQTLIFQYLGESLLMSVLSFAIAILIVDLCLPQFNTITGKNLSIDFNLDLSISIVAIVLFTGLVAGSYPALYLSGFKPATVLKGKLNNSLGELWARKGLVIFQFTLSVILIVSVLVVYNQIQFLQTKHLGYDKDNVIYFQMEGKVKENAETFINEIKKIPGIVNASSIGQSMVGGGNTTDIEWEGKAPEDRIPFAVRPVNYDVIEMLDIDLVEGRSFSRKFNEENMKVIINEAGIKAMGLTDPIGKEIKRDPFTFQIIGVAKDFHFESLHTNVKPMLFIMRPDFTEKIVVKIASGMETKTIQELQKFYLQFNPGFTLDYRFMDQDYQAQYIAEEKVATLSKYFASLAVLISCLGLFGLAAFTAERRLKEVGIRKVLGASELKIVYLLSGDFTKIVFVAIILALPVSYIITKNWLNGFAYKIPLEWWYFISGGLLALIIAVLTVSMQAWKAASVNPTQCLKDE